MTTLVLIAQLTTLVVLNAAGAVVSTQDYTLECGLEPKFIKTLPLVNPTEYYVDDPADQTKDCRALIAAQVQSLPSADGYRIASLENGVLSNPFTVEAFPPPPPVTTCVYQGVTYAAPHTLLVQFRAPTAAADVEAMRAAGWTVPPLPVKMNKQWQWWAAACA